MHANRLLYFVMSPLWGVLVLIPTMTMASIYDPPPSPCPGVFDYERSPSGTWQGVVNIISRGYFSELTLGVNFTVLHFIPEAGPGILKVHGGQRELNEVNRLTSRRKSQVIKFVVTFPATDEVPRLNTLTVNGENFCMPQLTKVSGPGGSISLHYTLATGLTGDCRDGFSPPDPPLFSYDHMDISRKTYRNVDSDTPPPSPCPGVFDYLRTPSGEWQGLVRITSNGYFDQVLLEVKFGLSHFRPDLGAGKLNVDGGMAEANNIADRAWRREIQVLKFVVVFPLGEEIPSVRNVTVNGIEFCSFPHEPCYPASSVSLSYTLSTGVVGRGEDGFSSHNSQTYPLPPGQDEIPSYPIQPVQPAQQSENGLNSIMADKSSHSPQFDNHQLQTVTAKPSGALNHVGNETKLPPTNLNRMEPESDWSEPESDRSEPESDRSEPEMVPQLPNSLPNVVTDRIIELPANGGKVIIKVNGTQAISIHLDRYAVNKP